jgi:hypothetical protein
MAYERIPLQARLNTAEDQAFTEEAKRHDMTRAGLTRWLVDVYLSDTATGRKLRTVSKPAAPPEKPPKVTKKRGGTITPTPAQRAAAAKPRRAKPRVSVTDGRCIHGNLGLCMACANDRRAMES